MKRIAVFCVVVVWTLSACGDENSAAKSMDGQGSKGSAEGSRRGPWGGGKSPRSAKAAVPVRAEAVERGEIVDYVETFARLEAERWVEVVARSSGVVTALRVEEGDRVLPDDVLVQLDKGQLVLRRKQAEVAVEQAQAVFQRTRMLFQRELVSEEEYDNADHQLRNQQVALEEDRLNLDYTDIRSPIAGVIMQRRIEVGSMVQVGQSVLSVADLRPLLVRIRIPEKRVHQVHTGQEARMLVEALPDRIFGGRVQMINPGVDPQSGTVKVTVEVPSDDNLLKPGMFAKVQLITERHDSALLIPKKALILETDQDDVFVIDGDLARRQQVVLGFSEGDRVEVVEGLTESSRIITVGQEGLKDGAAVREVAP